MWQCSFGLTIPCVRGTFVASIGVTSSLRGCLDFVALPGERRWSLITIWLAVPAWGGSAAVASSTGEF